MSTLGFVLRLVVRMLYVLLIFNIVLLIKTSKTEDSFGEFDDGFLISAVLDEMHDGSFDSEDVTKEIVTFHDGIEDLERRDKNNPLLMDLHAMEKQQLEHFDMLLSDVKAINKMWRLLIAGVVITVAQGRYENVNVKQDWWQHASIYSIYIRSFMDSDGDGVGDINGITSRLEYLKELGVDTACLSPIFKSPMHDFGFDVADYYTIHPEYGTMEDFDQLLSKASDLNIKILLEFVPNHTSNESEWFIRSSNKDEYYSDWYIWENGHIDDKGQRKPPNNWISVFRKSAWTYSSVRDQYFLHQFSESEPDLNYRNPVVLEEMKVTLCRVDLLSVRDQYYLHQFSESEPDLNYRNPVVLEEMKTIIKFWLEKGVAGMKMSSVNHVFEVDKDSFGGRYPDEPKTGKPGLGPDDYAYLDHVYTKDSEECYELISQFREVFNAITVRDNITRVLMTEANTGIKNAVRYYGDRVHSGAHIPLNTALIDDINKDSDARDFKFYTDRWMTYKPLKKKANWMSGSHDQSRVASRFRPELVDAYNMLVLLLPGIAMTYMGEEIGMMNGFVSWVKTKDPLACNTDDPVNFIDVSRDPVRTPFQWSNGKNGGFSTAENPWLPVAEGYEALNAANQRSAVRSHYQVYRTLTNLRMRPAFRLGRYESLALNSDVFAFKRWYNDDAYIVAMNVGKHYSVVNLTAFDLIFGQMEVEASSVLSTRTYSENIHANFLDLAADEAIVLRMQV